MNKEDLRQAMQDAQQVQLEILKIQERLAGQVIEVNSANNLVHVAMTAQGDMQKIKIHPNAVSDIPALEQAILEAIRNATTKAADLTKEQLAAVNKTLGL